MNQITGFEKHLIFKKGAMIFQSILFTLLFFIPTLNGKQSSSLIKDGCQDEIFIPFQSPHIPQNKSIGLYKSEIFTLPDTTRWNAGVVLSGVSNPQLIRTYIRVKIEGESNWSPSQEFSSEWHFQLKSHLTHFQMVYVVFNPKRLPLKLDNIQVTGMDFKPIFNQTQGEEDHFKPWPLPELITRAAWKARPPRGEYASHQPEKIVIHHSWKPTVSEYSGEATIRGIQNFHMDASTHKWMDIGYHYLIGPDGKIFSGRPETAVGAHAVPNSTMLGICLIGNHDPEGDPVNQKSVAALENLLSYLSSLYKIHPVNYFGHRNFSSKSCPGDSAFALLPSLRAKVLKNLTPDPETPDN